MKKTTKLLLSNRYLITLMENKEGVYLNIFDFVFKQEYSSIINNLIEDTSKEAIILFFCKCFDEEVTDYTVTILQTNGRMILYTKTLIGSSFCIDKEIILPKIENNNVKLMKLFEFNTMLKEDFCRDIDVVENDEIDVVENDEIVVVENDEIVVVENDEINLSIADIIVVEKNEIDVVKNISSLNLFNIFIGSICFVRNIIYFPIYYITYIFQPSFITENENDIEEKNENKNENKKKDKKKNKKKDKKKDKKKNKKDECESILGWTWEIPRDFGNILKKEKDDENEKNNKNPKNIDIDWGLHIKGTTPLDKINNSYPNCYTIKELSPNNTYKHSDIITHQKPSKFDNISISSRNLPYFKNILDHDLRKEVNIDE